MHLLEGIYIHVPLKDLFNQEIYLSLKHHGYAVSVQCFQRFISFTKLHVIFEQNVVVKLLDKCAVIFMTSVLVPS